MNQKRRISLILALCMALSLLLGACTPQTDGSTPASAGGKVKYQVTVVDPNGNPFTDGIAVKFMQNGVQVAMQTTDANGVAARELPAGDYTAELLFTEETAVGKTLYEYEGADTTLTATKTDLTIQVYNAVLYGERDLYMLNVKLDSSSETHQRQAYYIREGMSRVKLMITGERNFFIFTPTRGGIYEFRIENGDMVGNYGTTQYVYNISNHLERESERCFTMNIRNSDVGDSGGGTNQIVIGIDAGEATDTLLTVTRVADPEKMLNYEIYPTTTRLTAYKHTAGASIENIDVFAASGTYTLVYNESDGFYHLNSADGPLLLVRLGSKSDRSNEDGATNDITKCPYLASLESLASAPINREYYDENGQVVKGVDFKQCILDHVPFADAATGFYPVTKELEHILKEYGEYKGWWDPITRPSGENNYLFSGGTVNEEYAWMFNCCFVVD